MRRLVFLALAFCWALWSAEPAQAAIGAPVAITTTSISGIVSGVGVVVTADAPIGSLIVVTAQNFSAVNATITGCVLSSGDALTQASQNAAQSGIFSSSIWFASNTAHDLPISGTITCTTSTGTYSLVGYKITGANGPLDKTNKSASSSASGVLLATGTMCNASEIIMANTQLGSETTYTESANFTQLVNGSVQETDIAYDIVSATTSVAYAPSWTPAAGYGLTLATFQATGTPNCASSSAMMMLGIGP